jgi:hypothetical protein
MDHEQGGQFVADPLSRHSLQARPVSYDQFSRPPFYVKPELGSLSHCSQSPHRIVPDAVRGHGTDQTSLKILATTMVVDHLVKRVNRGRQSVDSEIAPGKVCSQIGAPEPGDVYHKPLAGRTLQYDTACASPGIQGVEGSVEAVREAPRQTEPICRRGNI